jgi:hypothetical protein
LSRPTTPHDSVGDASFRRGIQQLIAIDKAAERLSVESDSPYLQLGALRFYASDVVVDAGEHPVDSFQDELVLVLVDRHELKSEAAVCGFFVLTDKPVSMKPPDERCFIGAGRIRV